MFDWDDAFANWAHVEGSEKLPALWALRAEKYRASHSKIKVDLAYGPSARERFDLIEPATTAKGLVVFVHGGFWMRLDKSYWTDLAQGASARDWAVCIPSYQLTPDVKISEITHQIAASITKAADMIDGPIRLVGHSAGGHLVARMLCPDVPLPDKIRNRIEHTVSISGLHDLRPLIQTKMNDTLGLTIDEATSESAALLQPVGLPKLTVWVGGDERPEFIRQSRLLVMMWESFACKSRLVVEDGHNHFSVIEALKNPDSELSETLLAQD